MHRLVYAVALWLAPALQLCVANEASAQDSIPPNTFADPGAHLLLNRARDARTRQDSALQYYDALSNIRLVYRGQIRNSGFDRLLMSSEQAARVTWSRASGVQIERTGVRDASAMVSADLITGTPVPYWVGRDALWLPLAGWLQTRDLREGGLKHPLADGAERIYQYATGDSLAIRIGSSQTIRIRELRITPRRADWHAIVGSFWFDIESGALVRAVYRLSADIDIWELDAETHANSFRAALEQLNHDSSTEGAATRAKLNRKLNPTVLDRFATSIAKGSFQPLHVQVNAVSIEFGLIAGRLWLPKFQNAEATVLAGALRIPVKWEERFRFDSVSVVAPLTTVADNTTVDDTLLFRNSGPAALPAYASAVYSDSLFALYNGNVSSSRLRAQRAAATGDTSGQRRALQDAQRDAAFAQQVLRQRDGCLSDSTYFAGTMLQNGALRVDIRLPCNPESLRNSRDLSAIADEDEVFKSSDRDALYQALSMSLQPGWAPQAPKLIVGLSMVRYNRIEGLSLGAATSSELGRGFAARLQGRYGFADQRLNGEFSLARSNGTSQRTLTLFKRLGVANDLFGAPLSFGSSLTNVLFARDEGFYFRATGAELTGNNIGTAIRGALQHHWRIFAEGQRSAGVEPNTQASLANAIGDRRFTDNFDAASLSAVGMSLDLTRSFGTNAMGTRFSIRTRGEAARVFANDSSRLSGYGLLSAETSLSGGIGPLSASITSAAGISSGALPPQRSFFVGGLQTVRGQIARNEGAGRVGDSFWLARSEIGLLRSPLLRPALFFDAGWAGSRSDLLRRGKPLTGAGAGLSALDGLIRFDAARGIWPEKRWRYSLYLGARF